MSPVWASAPSNSELQDSCNNKKSFIFSAQINAADFLQFNKREGIWLLLRP